MDLKCFESSLNLVCCSFCLIGRWSTQTVEELRFLSKKCVWLVEHESYEFCENFCDILFEDYHIVDKSNDIFIKMIASIQSFENFKKLEISKQQQEFHDFWRRIVKAIIAKNVSVNLVDTLFQEVIDIKTENKENDIPNAPDSPLVSLVENETVTTEATDDATDVKQDDNELNENDVIIETQFDIIHQLYLLETGASMSDKKLENIEQVRKNFDVMREWRHNLQAFFDSFVKYFYFYFYFNYI